MRTNLLLLSFIFLLSHCGPAQNTEAPKPPKPRSFVVQLQIPLNLIHDSDSSLGLIFFKPDGRTPADRVKLLKFEPWMTIHGHGTYMDEQEFQNDAELKYLVHVRHVMFTMPGPWDLRVTAEVDGAVDTQIISVTVDAK